MYYWDKADVFTDERNMLLLLLLEIVVVTFNYWNLSVKLNFTAPTNFTFDEEKNQIRKYSNN